MLHTWREEWAHLSITLPEQPPLYHITSHAQPSINEQPHVYMSSHKRQRGPGAVLNALCICHCKEGPEAYAGMGCYGLPFDRLGDSKALSAGGGGQLKDSGNSLSALLTRMEPAAWQRSSADERRPEALSPPPPPLLLLLLLLMIDMMGLLSSCGSL